MSGDYRVALGKGAWPSGDIVIYKYENTWSYGIRTTGMVCGGSTTALPYLTTVDNTYHHIAVSMNASASRCDFYSDGQIADTDEFVSGTTVFATGAGLNNCVLSATVHDFSEKSCTVAESLRITVCKAFGCNHRFVHLSCPDGGA